MIIQRRALPIVCDSSAIWKVAADRSGAAPFNYGGDIRLARAHGTFAGIQHPLTILIFLAAGSAIWPARDLVREWETKDGGPDALPD